MLAAIWWAASVGSSTRAAIAVAPLNTASIDPTRSSRCRPAASRGAIPTRLGRRWTAGARCRRITTTKAMPAPTWAITVDQAEPATPHSKPNTNSSSSTTLTRFDESRMTSGVR